MESFRVSLLDRVVPHVDGDQTQVFKNYGTTCLSSVYFWASIPIYYVSDADAFRVINNERGVFKKDDKSVSDVNIVFQGVVK